MQIFEQKKYISRVFETANHYISRVFEMANHYISRFLRGRGDIRECYSLPTSNTISFAAAAYLPPREEDSHPGRKGCPQVDT